MVTGKINDLTLNENECTYCRRKIVNVICMIWERIIKVKAQAGQLFHIDSKESKFVIIE